VHYSLEGISQELAGNGLKASSASLSNDLTVNALATNPMYDTPSKLNAAGIVTISEIGIPNVFLFGGGLAFGLPSFP
jgi:hypothetical protein